MNVSPTAIPFHIARAYGVERAIAVSRARQAQPVQQTGPARAVEKRADGPGALVAAVVPGRIDFSQTRPAQRAAALAMYVRPSERNAAATGVEAGRVLDVSG